MNESANPILKYFSEFKILKTVSKDFWLTNVVQFFDGMAYFSMITVFVLYLTDYCSVKTMRTPMVSTRKRISLRKADSFHTSMKSWRGLRRGALMFASRSLGSA